ncbi:hypothetical protein BAE44_0011349 [Dichanthelium oligosanthes]|uniref:BTB domain-containing protein n=1 Tax=Dichanthelium oligosanthes TaxID=888268 RepID=A0A1E5VRB5_9POAL|nr:hypothetical protein BAE44_0011349 [Dichanthelium oligosanthes]
METWNSGRHSTMNMKHTCTGQLEEVRYVHLLKIDDFAVIKATVGNNKNCIKSSGVARDIQAPGLLTVECNIGVLRDQEAIRLPSSNLHQHFGELLQNQAGADVTFIVSGESLFAAHKNILAARSPVFMAEFFGTMAERSAQCVEIQDMEPAVFKAMLRYLSTLTWSQSLTRSQRRLRRP